MVHSVVNGGADGKDGDENETKGKKKQKWKKKVDENDEEMIGQSDRVMTDRMRETDGRVNRRGN